MSFCCAVCNRFFQSSRGLASHVRYHSVGDSVVSSKFQDPKYIQRKTKNLAAVYKFRSKKKIVNLKDKLVRLEGSQLDSLTIVNNWLITNSKYNYRRFESVDDFMMESSTSSCCN